MTVFTLLIALGIAAAFYVVLRRITVLEQELRRVESLVAGVEQHEARERQPKTATYSARSAPARAGMPEEPVPRAQPEAPPAKVPEARAEPRFSLESLIGGRLPIWIGGAALVLAGFFLVRYSIESGLLGPGARTALAALFGVALIAASEAARSFGPTREDPRVAQVLAGAGIASLYGTLYMAAALYHLIGPLTAFGAVLVVTAAALGLSLRHGPPTAVMALIGGFAAPLVAGFDAAGIGPLLVYLALFIAALFGLAIQRGWGWLALAASIAGFAWINFLIAALGGRPGDLSAVGAFTMLLAAGASAALPATGMDNRWLRIAPLVAGLVQLLALAPALEFGPLAWSFYLVLAAAALFLAWRDAVYAPAALAAAGFVLVLEALALIQPERSATPVAALMATLLFAVPGHLLASRSRHWGFIALLGTGGPLLVAHAAATSLLPALGWGTLELLATAGAAWIAWQTRDDDAPLLTAATALSGLLAAVGLAQLVSGAWLALPFAAVLLGLAGWARYRGVKPLFELPLYPYLAALLAAALPIAALADLVFAAVAGDRLPYLRLPPLDTLFRALALPTVALLGAMLDPRMLGRARRLVGGVAIAVGILLLYALAKQVLAIATLPRFATLGFFERALLTQLCLGAGWALLRKGRLVSLGGVLFTLGLCRFAWFDLLVISPLVEPQSVGALPIANAAVLHAALLAYWLWTLPPRPPLRIGAAAATLLTALVAVRQAAHGDLLTGPIGRGENGGYSAALLGVALFWLWRGIGAAKHDLRIAGLALLTMVTFKVFLIDAAALDGVLRILSFLALGLALIGIGWAYNRFLARPAAPAAPSD